MGKRQAKNLSIDELCEALDMVEINRNEDFVVDIEIEQWTSTIAEAMARLKKLDTENVELKKQVHELEDHIDDLWQEIPEKAPRRAIN